MDRQLLLLCVITFCICAVSTQRPKFGSCPKVRTAKNVTVDKFLGKWYEIERSFYVYEIPTSCTTLEVKRVSNSSSALKVTISTHNTWTGSSSTSYGTAYPRSDKSAVLDYRVESRLPAAIARLLPGAGRYSVLATDHEHYAVIYSCSDLRFMHADLIWILGRKSDLPVWARAEAYDKLTSEGFETSHLTLTKRKNCPSQFSENEN